MSERRLNTSHDGSGYDHETCTHDITDANALYEAWLKAKSGSDWKGKVQMFEMDWLHQISMIQKEIRNREYKPRKPTAFTIYERGKQRCIHGEQVRDRVIEHSLNDNVVVPSIRPYLIYDNGASLEGKGIDFTRNRLVKHLVNFYHHYGNDGYVLLMDYSKYYDNIRHDILMNLFRQYITDDTAIYLLETIINDFGSDVGVNIGNQTSQSAGIMYPTSLDNYIKIIHGVKHYVRYMDDSVIIHQDKEYLKDLELDCVKYANDNLGIMINTDKTRIVKLSDSWRFLQIQYSLTNTGRIMKKINPKRVTKMRQKMKKLAPVMSAKEYEDWVFSWLKSQKKYLSHKQYSEIVHLYDELKGVTEQ